MNLFKKWAGAMAICSLLFTFNSLAETHFVDINGTNPVAPFTDWSMAATNIQDAIDASADGDTILVTNGVYATGGKMWFDSGTNRVTLTNAVTLKSVNGPAFTLIVGHQVAGTGSVLTNAVRCVGMGNNAVLSGFTLTNGEAGWGHYPAGGGAANLVSGTSTVTNCVLIGNLSTNGAGGGANRVKLINCQLIGNYAYNGGGACACTLINCTVVSNTATSGGGVYGSSTYGSSFLTNCTIVGNSAGSGGGSYSGTLDACSVSNNTAVNGGGAFGGNLNNSLVTGNSAASGGGIYGNGATISDCTVVANNATNNGGGIYGGTGAWCYNSVFYYNTAPIGSNNVGTKFNSCCTIPNDFDPAGITNKPLFVNLAGGNFHLQSDSPCINAGDNAHVFSSTDLDHNARIVNGSVDMGAYEYQGNIRYVSMDSTNPIAPYSDWSVAATNIQDAIDAAADGDLILVTNGVYATGGRVVYGSMTNRVVIDKAVAVRSVNGPVSTVIAGLPGTGALYSTGFRCIYMTNGSSLAGFTLTNGATRNSGDLVKEKSGAAIWCESISATVSNCILTHNFSSGYGGAAYQGTLNNCTISNNSSAYDGGGTYQAYLNNSMIIGNQTLAGVGGGVAYGSSSNCLVTQNYSSSPGGGAYSTILNNCVITNNHASSGGGAYSSTLNNCLLQNNFATSTGGGASDSFLVNCTVVSNYAGSAGGGIISGGASNTIIYYNSSPKPAGNNQQQSITSFCCTTPQPSSGTGNITNEPAFIDLATGNLRLKSNSPCINSGNNAYVTITNDLDGNPRIVGGTVDMGAYEYPTPSSVLSYAWAQQHGLPIDGTADHADTDGDGMNNYAEWKSGTNPTNSLSLLKLESPVSTNNAYGIVVTWQSVTNVTYYLQRNSDLTGAFSSIQSNLVGQVSFTSYTDASATNDGPYFYRVGVQ